MNAVKVRAFGNLCNRIMETAKTPAPVAGMGATILMYSDRKAATICFLQGTKAGKVNCVTVREDRAIRTDKNGMSDAQSYIYERNDDAPLIAYTLRSNGAWVRLGESGKSGQRLLIGTRDHHHDYSF